MDLGNDQKDKDGKTVPFLSFENVLSFDGKLWIFGCRQENFPREEVRSSADGAHWTKVNNNAGFSYWGWDAVAHTIVFNGKMMLFRSRDITVSADGKKWTKLADEPFAPRVNYGAAVFDNKIWIFGGLNNVLGNGVTRDPPIVLKDIWSSSDGIHWTRLSTEIPFTVAAPSCAVSKCKLWLLGGEWTWADREKKLWSSGDGIHWDCVNAELPFTTDFNTILLSWNDELFLTKNPNGEPPFHLEDYWTSSDGVTWKLKSDQHWVDWYEHETASSAVVHQDKIFAFEKGALPTNLHNIWSSADGEQWNKVTNPVINEVISGTYLSFKGKIWSIGRKVFSSADGVAWTEMPYTLGYVKDGSTNTTDYVPRWAVGFKDKIFILAGMGKDESGIWSSADGVKWTQATIDLPTPYHLIGSFQVFNGKLWIVAGDEGSREDYGDDDETLGTNYHLGDVWNSMDGIHWNLVTDKGPFGLYYDEQKNVVLDNEMFLIGGDKQIWHTLDGENWIKDAAKEGLPAGRFASNLAFHDKLWFLGGEDNDDSWYSP
jgi:hypothetical protein